MTSPTTSSKASEPLPLATTTWGDGPRRLLLLHGIGSNAAGWWRLGPDVAEAGYQVVAADLRGHGLSPHSADMRLASHAADVVGLGAWDVVVGHSLGGTVAVLAAASHPEWVDRLVLLDPALASAAVPRAEIEEWLLAPWVGPITAESVARTNPGWHPEDARIKSESLHQTSPDVIRAIVGDMVEVDVVSPLTRLTTPTVILGSDPEMGAIVPVALGEWLDAEHGHLTFRWFRGWEHSPHRQPERYTEVLAALLEAAA